MIENAFFSSAMANDALHCVHCMSAICYETFPNVGIYCITCMYVKADATV